MTMTIREGSITTKHLSNDVHRATVDLVEASVTRALDKKEREMDIHSAKMKVDVDTSELDDAIEKARELATMQTDGNPELLELSKMFFEYASDERTAMMKIMEYDRVTFRGALELLTNKIEMCEYDEDADETEDAEALVEYSKTSAMKVRGLHMYLATVAVFALFVVAKVMGWL